MVVKGWIRPFKSRYSKERTPRERVIRGVGSLDALWLYPRVSISLSRRRSSPARPYLFFGIRAPCSVANAMQFKTVFSCSKVRSANANSPVFSSNLTSMVLMIGGSVPHDEGNRCTLSVRRRFPAVSEPKVVTRLSGSPCRSISLTIIGASGGSRTLGVAVRLPVKTGLSSRTARTQ